MSGLTTGLPDSSRLERVLSSVLVEARSAAMVTSGTAGLATAKSVGRRRVLAWIKIAITFKMTMIAVMKKPVLTMAGNNSALVAHRSPNGVCWPAPK